MRRRSDAEKYFLKAAVEKLIQKYEQLMRVQVSGVTIRQMKTRWGSCNVKRIISTLIWHFMRKDRSALSMWLSTRCATFWKQSHNKIFWGYVAQYFPDWKNVRARLNEEGV